MREKQLDYAAPYTINAKRVKTLTSNLCLRLKYLMWDILWTRGGVSSINKWGKTEVVVDELEAHHDQVFDLLNLLHQLK